jgi:hypothetical protein
MSDIGICRAVTEPGLLITAYLPDGNAAMVTARRDRWFICSQHPDHRGGHTACDGHGHVLVSWPRRKPERYWHPDDCTGCTHHAAAVIL